MGREFLVGEKWLSPERLVVKSKDAKEVHDERNCEIFILIRKRVHHGLLVMASSSSGTGCGGLGMGDATAAQVRQRPGKRAGKLAISVSSPFLFQ
jgi:hypothetical protein